MHGPRNKIYTVHFLYGESVSVLYVIPVTAVWLKNNMQTAFAGTISIQEVSYKTTSFVI
jgi:hypothetical protein